MYGATSFFLGETIYGATRWTGGICVRIYCELGFQNRALVGNSRSYKLVATLNRAERACKHENIQPGRVGLGLHMAIYGHAGNAIWFTSHMWKHIFATNWFGN